MTEEMQPTDQEAFLNLLVSEMRPMHRALLHKVCRDWEEGVVELIYNMLGRDLDEMIHDEMNRRKSGVESDGTDLRNMIIDHLMVAVHPDASIDQNTGEGK